MKLFRIVALLLISGCAVAAPKRILDSVSPNKQMAAAVMQFDKVVHLWLSGSNSKELCMVAAFARVKPQFAMPLGKDYVPLSAEFASPTAFIEGVKPKDLSLVWSPNGAAVSLFYKGDPLAFVVFGEEYGYSKAIAKSYPFGGHPWNEDRYQKIFHPAVHDALN